MIHRVALYHLHSTHYTWHQSIELATIIQGLCMTNANITDWRNHVGNNNAHRAAHDIQKPRLGLLRHGIECDKQK